METDARQGLQVAQQRIEPQVLLGHVRYASEQARHHGAGDAVQHVAADEWIRQASGKQAGPAHQHLRPALAHMGFEGQIHGAEQHADEDAHRQPVGQGPIEVLKAVVVRRQQAGGEGAGGDQHGQTPGTDAVCPSRLPVAPGHATGEEIGGGEEEQGEAAAPIGPGGRGIGGRVAPIDGDAEVHKTAAVGRRFHAEFVGDVLGNCPLPLRALVEGHLRQPLRLHRFEHPHVEVGQLEEPRPVVGAVLCGIGRFGQRPEVQQAALRVERNPHHAGDVQRRVGLGGVDAPVIGRPEGIRRGAVPEVHQRRPGVHQMLPRLAAEVLVQLLLVAGVL